MKDCRSAVLREARAGLLDDGKTAEGRRLQRFAAFGFTARGPLFEAVAKSNPAIVGAKDGAPD